MALHLGKSHGRQVNQGRNAFPQVTLLPIALLALCTFHAGCAPSTPRNQSAVAAAKPSVETRSKDVTERLKQDVDRLIATDFHDIAALNAQLQTQLGPGESQDVMVIRAGVSGVLAGAALKRIELRSNQDAPSHATLVLDFSPPGPMFEGMPSPDASLYPPRPDAAGSSAYWSMQRETATVIFGLNQDQSGLSYITISKK
ncbi:hypothetical protein VDF98_12465 [Xanthomonas campestris pv. raphani]|uniref:hypothetical protein n=1 Tax=Xanthomonas campestris TaxID=339 RepID=UPI0005C4F011|nr:hypothetical protein [Xanthomonas campestris]MEA9654737.1 hypothetical protein [Xanthomonas campestris pv. raphani]MEA9676243.1 hypothetical protein [Xanthomonas campestris pv. raphani]MEA9765645.1 hypothetical protein [Xanthomonas campestris pv. raphani]MEA9777582.1 hypothetical protein [Xanthomonas campestris pv. raphani]MEA9817863.1 hypothetical protein [Xanthomonas campestris pv. raphani]